MAAIDLDRRLGGDRMFQFVQTNAPLYSVRDAPVQYSGLLFQVYIENREQVMEPDLADRTGLVGFTEIDSDPATGTGTGTDDAAAADRELGDGVFKEDEDAASSSRKPDCYVPDDVWLRVLERLPWAGVLRARSVCKRWLKLIESPHFDQAVSSQPPWLFVSTTLDDTVKDDLHAYDPATDRWHSLPLDFLLKHQPGSRWTVVSSTGGLVYVMQEPCRDQRTVAYSGYPRSREPVTPVVWTFLGDDASHSRCHHLLVASSCDGWGTRLYCPTDCDWEEVGEGHPKLRDSRDSKYACSVRDEKFFVLVEDEIDAGLDSYGFEQVEYRIVLLGFDAADGFWEEYSMFPFERAEDAVIVEFHDYLHLVAASCESDRLCIRVYKFLEKKRDAWVEVTATSDLCPWSFKSRLGFFQLACATAGDLLYVVGYCEDSAVAGLCDFSQGLPRWRRISSLPFTTVGFCFCCSKKIDSSHFW